MVRGDPVRRLTLLSVVVGFGLAILLVGAWMATGSQLALSQAADSIVDVLTAGALYWAARIGQEPPDRRHPEGHHAAEAIAALVVAVIAGALALEVASEAIHALQQRSVPRLNRWLAVAFALKVAAKGVIAAEAYRTARRTRSPAVSAIAMDARNDVLLGVSAIVGFIVARAGYVMADALMALPVAVWIGVAAVMLGVENVQLLLGASASEGRRHELQALASQVPGVRRAEALRAVHRGAGLSVWVQVTVDRELRIGDAHDIGQAVEDRIRNEDDVVSVVAHVEAD